MVMKAKLTSMLIALVALPATAQVPPSPQVIAIAAAASPKVPADRKQMVQNLCQQPPDQATVTYCVMEAQNGMAALLENYRQRPIK